MTLWTPDGEHPIDPASSAAGAPGAAPSELSPEQEEQAREMARQMSEARAQLLETEGEAGALEPAELRQAMAEIVRAGVAGLLG